MKVLYNTGNTNSGTYALNRLTKDGKSYVMDNHLAASWCWSQQLDFTKTYHLFHIDRHYDLLRGPLEYWLKRLDTINFDFRTCTIEELLQVRTDTREVNHQLFRFDNYLTLFNTLHPNIFEKSYFATHNDGSRINDMISSDKDIWDLPNNLHYWMANTEEKWVVNLDIDYFFTDGLEDTKYQFLSDAYIDALASALATVWDRIEVFTIALSPEFCGSLENATRVARLITDALNIDF